MPPDKNDPFILELARLSSSGRIDRWPRVGHKELDLRGLFVAVHSRGGYDNVVKQKLWKDVKEELSLPDSVTNAGFVLKGKYLEYFKEKEDKLIPFLTAATPTHPIPTELPTNIGMQEGRTLFTPHVDQLGISSVYDTTLPPLPDVPIPSFGGPMPDPISPPVHLMDPMNVDPAATVPQINQPGTSGFVLRNRVEGQAAKSKVVSPDVMDKRRPDPTSINVYSEPMAYSSPDGPMVPMRILTEIIKSLGEVFNRGSVGQPQGQLEAMQPLVSFMRTLSDEAIQYLARAWAFSIFPMCNMRIPDGLHVHHNVNSLMIIDPLNWSGLHWPVGDVRHVNIVRWETNAAVAAAALKAYDKLHMLIADCSRWTLQEFANLGTSDPAKRLKILRLHSIPDYTRPDLRPTAPTGLLAIGAKDTAMDEAIHANPATDPRVAQSAALTTAVCKLATRLQLDELVLRFNSRQSPIFMTQDTPNRSVRRLFVEHGTLDLSIVFTLFPSLTSLQVRSSVIHGEHVNRNTVIALDKFVLDDCMKIAPNDDRDPTAPERVPMLPVSAEDYKVAERPVPWGDPFDAAAGSMSGLGTFDSHQLVRYNGELPGLTESTYALPGAELGYDLELPTLDGL